MSNTSLSPPLLDGQDRLIRYLRLSVTDRCNFKCVYCRGVDCPTYLPHDKILRYEEMLRFARIVVGLGVNKIRLTGGEPLVRKDCVNFFGRLRDEFPDARLALTTNGSLLGPHIESLRKIRPASINVSLDTFNEDDYRRLTGSSLLPLVRTNILALLDAGIKVKINAVAIKGATEPSLDAFVRFALDWPVDIRFIEFMPMGRGTIWSADKFLSAASLLDLVRLRVDARPAQDADAAGGPARMYEISGGKGRIGFISAVSSHFCRTCDRLRLTSEGNLRACLFDDREIRLAPLLKNASVPDEEIIAAIREACRTKPLGARILAARGDRAAADKRMTSIGG